MRIAFYAPLKPPGHPVPSGDRLMARLLIRALETGGHQVALASDLRAWSAAPGSGALARLQAAAAAEAVRISRDWDGARPDLWLSYHPYYKSPDLIGPALAARHGLPYATVESSWSSRREATGWAAWQAPVLAGLRQAAVNISLTARDAAGIAEAAPGARVERLFPFIDPLPFSAPARPEPGHIVTTAMMRPGDKIDSYRLLAAALALLPPALPWRLSVIGDGPERAAVAALLAGLPQGRIAWLGQLPQDAVAEHLSTASLFLWPGCGEAYGLSYLEAQAAGVPVVAMTTAGVPEVVLDGETGLLTPPGDAAALAASTARLLRDPARAAAMGTAARDFVARDRSLEGAACRLDAILRSLAVTE